MPKGHSSASAVHTHNPYGSDSRIIMNENRGARRMANDKAEMMGIKWWAQGNPMSHELGHEAHLRIDPEGWKGMGRTPHQRTTPEERAYIGRHVSGYAATDGHEFVAETIGGIRSGRVYDSRVMGVFHRVTNGKFQGKF
jgi:hypothetical protein